MANNNYNPISFMRESHVCRVCSKVTLTTFLFYQLSSVAPVFASPTGGTVVGGEGSIDYQGANTTINQASNRMAIDWQTFNVGENESVQFIQPGRDSISLNRILDQNPSQIFGRIDANGNVMLINARGIIFGRSASINVGGLVASSLDVNPAEFINNDSFAAKGVDGTDGVVVNQGLINAATGGSVSLIGQSVENQGIIVANLGKVNLAAGSEAVLTFGRDRMIGVEVTKEVLENDVGVDSAVLNSGVIMGEGAQVALTAKVSKDLFSNAVNNTGIIQASGIEERGGSIYLTGSGGGVNNQGTLDASSSGTGVDGGTVVATGDNVNNSGVITADAKQGNGGVVELNSQDTTTLTGGGSISTRSASGGNGGKVMMLGDKVGLFDQSSIDASGDQGGGIILIGGDERGENPEVKNATATYVGNDTKVSADAVQDGEGGKVIVYANESAKIYGDISAKGGEQSGDGGFVETSGKNYLDINVFPNVSANAGTGGSWLIDPYNVIISANPTNTSIDTSATSDPFLFPAIGYSAVINVGLIEDSLSGGASVTITTGNGSGIQQGNITLDTDLNYDGAGNGTLTLSAANNIEIKNRIYDGDITTSDTLNLIFQGDNNLDGSGNVSLTTYTNPEDQIVTNGGAVAISGVDFDNSLDVHNVINAGNGSIDITITGNANLGKLVTDSNLTLRTTSTSSAVTISQSSDSASGLQVGGLTTLNSNTRDITLDNPNNHFNSVTIENGRNVTLLDANDITFSDVILSGTLTTTAGFQAAPGLISVSDGAALSTMGNINLNGSVQLGGGSSITTNGGNLTIGNATLDSGSIALGNTNGPATISTGGGDFTTLNKGSFTMANGSSIDTDGGVFTANSIASLNASTGSIDTSGAKNTDGGKVEITTKMGGLKIGSIIAKGGGTFAGDDGKTGGDVVLTTLQSGANITVDKIDTSGSNGIRKAGNNTNNSRIGGNGGKVELVSSGTVEAGSISTHGGNADGATYQAARNGGDAGLITFGDLTTTPDKIVLHGDIQAQGGAGSQNTNARAGVGKDIIFNRPLELGDLTGDLDFDSAVTITTTGYTNGDVTFDGIVNSQAGSSSLISLSLDVGSGNISFNDSMGTQQRLGDILINTTGDVLFNTDLSDLTVIANSLRTQSTVYNFVSTDTSHALNIDTSGVEDMAGGEVNVTANNTIQINSVKTSGGADASNTGGQKAGNVTLTANSVSVDSITATGSDSVADGGNGGAINVISNNQSLAISGGVNSSAGKSTASGRGGDAGSITIGATNGGLALATVSASGGDAVNGNGGTGGVVSITAANAIVLDGDVDSSGGSVDSAGNGSGGNAGATTVDSTSNRDINLKGDVIAAGGSEVGGNTVGNGANITFMDNVVLAKTSSALLISTGTGSGDIQFNRDVNGQTSGQNDLTLEAGSGSIYFGNSAGDDVGNSVYLGDITINSANSVHAYGQFNAGTIKQIAGSGTTQFDGAIVTTDANGVDLDGNNFVFQAITSNGTNAGVGINVIAAGTIDLGGDVNTAGTAPGAGHVNLQSGGSLTVANAINTNSGGGVTINLTNGSSNTLTLNQSVNTFGGDFKVTDAGDISVNQTVNTVGGEFNVTNARDVTVNQQISTAGGNITVGNSTSFDNSSSQGALSAGNGGVTINSSGPVTLGEITTSGLGRLDVTSTGGTIGQSTGTALNIAGDASFTAYDNASSYYNVTISNTGNNIGGATSVTGQDVMLNETSGNSVELGTSVVNNDLTINGDHAISQSGSISVGGLTSIDAQQNSVTLDNGGNDFNAVNIANTGNNNVAIADTNGIVIAGMNVGTGTLAITAGNGISQTGAIVQDINAAAVSLNGGSGQIDLSNGSNEFTGTVNIDGGMQANIADGSDLTLGTITLAGDFTASAGANLTANGNISLAENMGIGNGTLTLKGGQAGSGSRIDLGGATYAVAKITVNGGGGNDTLFVNDEDKDWTITGLNQGKISALTGVRDDDTAGNPALIFTSVERAEGGTGVDSFLFQGNGQMDQGVDGGGGNAVDVVDLSNQATVDITFGNNVANGVSNVEAVRGNGTDSTLRAQNVANTWSIDDTNSGMLQEDVSTQKLTFYDFNKLVGGSDKDEFNLSGNGAVTGYIDGNGSGGEADSISLAGLASNHQWTIDATDMSCNPCNRVFVDGTQNPVVASFYNITSIAGGSGTDTFSLSSYGQLVSVDGGGGTDTIVGADVDNVLWKITDNYQGTMAVNTVDQYTFSGIENIQGGTLADTFDFRANKQMNSVAGGGGADTIIGGGSGDRSWQLRTDGMNQYQNAQGGKITDFSGITAIQGGDNANDRFVFQNGADFTGTINGGSGGAMDTLDYSQFTTAIDVNLTDGTATGTTGISNMEDLIGGLGVDSLTGTAGVNNWSISGINSGNVNSFTFSSVENLTGGDMNDTFNVSATGNVTGSIQGAAGDDTLNVFYGNAGRTLVFDGGADANTVNLTGSAPGQNSAYTLSDASPNRLVSIMGNQTVDMSNIDQVNDQVTADSITITGSDSANTVQIGAAGADFNGSNPTSVAFSNFVPINFSNKQNVTIDGGGATDSVSLAANITVNGVFTLTAEEIAGSAYTVTAADLVLKGFDSIGATDQPLRTNVNTLTLDQVAGSAYLLESNGLTLTGSNVGGDLALATASGDITSSGALTVGGDLVVTGANGSSVYLNNAGNALAGELSFTTFNPSADSLNNVQVSNNSGVVLGSVNTNNLIVTAVGDITDSAQVGSVKASGLAQLNANGHSILLDGAGNDFGIVETSSHVNEFNVTDVNDIGLAAISADTVVVNAGGQISNAGTDIVANSAELNAQNGVGNNGALTTTVEYLNISNTSSGNVNIDNSGDLVIASISNMAAASTGGNVTVTNSGSITQSGQISAGNNVSLFAGGDYAQQGNIAANNNVSVMANDAITMQNGTRTDSQGATINYTSLETVTVSSLDAVYGVGRVEVSSGRGNIFSSRAPDLSQANITGNYAVFSAPSGSLGEPGRPLVINIPGTVVINTFTSVAPIYLVIPSQIIDTSRLLFDVNEAITEVGGNQRTEVDALAIVDPAVFTHVKNYSEDLYPVKLPPDQLLSDDEDKKKKTQDPDIFETEAK